MVQNINSVRKSLDMLFNAYGQHNNIKTKEEYFNLLKDLNCKDSEFHAGICSIVDTMNSMPSISEIKSLINTSSGYKESKKQVFYDSQNKAAEDERKLVSSLKEQFKNALCDGNDESYTEIMSMIIKAWFIKVYEYSLKDFEELRIVTPLMVFERCVLIDWRDSNFSTDFDKIFEIAKSKRNKK